MASSDTLDRALVGGFFGLVAGTVAFVVVMLWALFSPRLSPRSIWPLHLGYTVLYALAGAVIGMLWPLRSSTPGRWGLWFLATATGAVTVNSVAAGPPWEWSLTQWRSCALLAILFTPVFAWDWPWTRRAP